MIGTAAASAAKRPFSCDSCPMTFKKRCHLADHKLSKHSGGQKQHQCPKCESKFAREFTLKQHMKYRHSNDKPYECKHCALRYKEKRAWIKHEKRHREQSVILIKE
ncbi:hypothetical protein FGO68_gene8585 [Halteria grandinella]|uniref:C2H2-type domain-containing protein n=1 Tax=Halteria grandinella TaxID=5974 RepID=A0A8J8NWC5_HALGN|nr:hypothetical protein FGO68_gene8585 [Halteria grandinella]